MKANMFKMTAILALGVFFVAPAMAFDVCGNGYCCTWCVPDESLYCTADCGPRLIDEIAEANVESAPAEDVCALESAAPEAPEATFEASAVETAPSAD